MAVASALKMVKNIFMLLIVLNPFKVDTYQKTINIYWKNDEIDGPPLGHLCKYFDLDQARVKMWINK